MKAIGEAHARGAAKFLGLPGKAAPQPVPAQVQPTPASQPAAGSFLIRVKAASLWYYDRPDWNAKKATVKAGEVFTVVETIVVNGSKMYKLKSGNYMTANPQYVEII
ncbi:hypothetical protein D1872_304670 [compost metagenome]